MVVSIDRLCLGFSWFRVYFYCLVFSHFVVDSCFFNSKSVLLSILLYAALSCICVSQAGLITTWPSGGKCSRSRQSKKSVLPCKILFRGPGALSSNRRTGYTKYPLTRI